MNTICLDPSLTCSALVVNDKKFVYVADHIVETKNGLKKWFERVSDLITIRMHRSLTATNFSDDEIKKLDSYDGITDAIITDILQTIDPNEDSAVYIEGYSYSSAAGPLIDLVTFGTLIRKKLADQFTYVVVVPPSSLKLEAAKLTYTPTKKGKKDVYRNNQGVAGGSFKKHDMYKVLTENTNLKCPWVDMLISYSDEILAQKAIPKPIEDLNDAKIMYEVYKNK